MSEEVSLKADPEVFCKNPFTGEELKVGQSYRAWNFDRISYNDPARCESEQRICTAEGTFTGSFKYPGCAKENPGDCILEGIRNGVPEMVGVKHGESVTVFSTDRVPFEGNCADKKHVRTCNNGVLSLPNYNQLACSPDPGAACNVILRKKGINQPVRKINHLDKINNLFANYELPNGTKCGSGETLECYNGSIRGTANREIECRELPKPKLNCSLVRTINGVAQAPVSILDGDKYFRRLYKKHNPGVNEKCEDQEVWCNDGVLSQTTHVEENCKELKNCEGVRLKENGVLQAPITMTHGTTIKDLNLTHAPAPGVSCDKKDLTCNDGVLSQNPLTHIERFCTTTALPKDCSLPLTVNGVPQAPITLKHGETYKDQLFLKHNPAPGVKCDKLPVSCNDGKLSQDSHLEVNCSEIKNCNGVILTVQGVAQSPITINHGDKISGLFKHHSPASGSVCSVQKDLSCNNGQLIGDHFERECTNPARDCQPTVIKQDGQTFQTVSLKHGEKYPLNLFDRFSAPFNSGLCGTPIELKCIDGSYTQSTHRETRCNYLPATFTDINIDGQSGSTPADPVKLFMIVDFSPSMAQELTRVKDALRLFMTSQRSTQAFDIKVFGIDHAVSAVGAPAGKFVLTAPGASLSLRSTTTDANIDSFFTQMDSYRLSLGYTAQSNIIEKGLCQIVRLLKDNRYVTPTDKVSFITVTDEDDGSLLNCIEGTQVIQHAGYRNLHLNKNLHNLVVQFTISGSYVNCYTPDGGQQICATEIITPYTNVYIDECAPGSVYQPRCQQQFLGQSFTCNAAELADIQTRIQGWYGSSSVTASNCSLEYRNIVHSVLTISESEINKTLEEVMAGEQFSFTNGTNPNFTGTYHDYALLFNHANVTIGEIQSHPPYAQTQDYHHAEFNGSMTYTNAIRLLIDQKIDKNNGGKIAMNFVIFDPSLNPSGTTCDVGGNEAIGALYSGLVNHMHSTNPANIPFYQRESICQDSYSNSLLLTTGLATWTAFREYTLVGQNAANINGIVGIRIVHPDGATMQYNLGQQGVTIDPATKVLYIPSPIALPQHGRIVLLGQ